MTFFMAVQADKDTQISHQTVGSQRKRENIESNKREAIHHIQEIFSDINS